MSGRRARNFSTLPGSEESNRRNAPPLRGPARWIVVALGTHYRCGACGIALPPGSNAVYDAPGIRCPDHRPKGRIEGRSPEALEES